MERRNRTIVGISVLAIATFALIAFAQAPARQRSTSDKQQVDRDMLTSLADITDAVSDDGYWELAGVVGLSTRPDGTLAVEVKADGSFETDPVLTIPVSLWESPDGEIGVFVESVRRMPGSVEITLTPAVPGLGGVAAMHTPCVSVVVSGQLRCIPVDCGVCTREQVGELSFCKCNGGDPA